MSEHKHHPEPDEMYDFVSKLAGEFTNPLNMILMQPCFFHEAGELCVERVSGLMALICLHLEFPPEILRAIAEKLHTAATMQEEQSSVRRLLMQLKLPPKYG